MSRSHGSLFENGAIKTTSATDESAASARYEVASLGRGDHKRSLLMPMRKRVGALSFGSMKSRIGAQRCWRQAASDYADI